MAKYSLGYRVAALLASTIPFFIFFVLHRSPDYAQHSQKNETRPLTDEIQDYQCPTLAELFNCPSVRNQSGFICRECISSWPSNGRITAPKTNTRTKTKQKASAVAASGEQIYMMLLVPPFWGSSMLLNLISSSPAVSNMCKFYDGLGGIPWQCESFPLLKNAEFLTKDEMWTLNYTLNFSAYFDFYHKNKVWVDMNAPILLEKSPYYIIRIPQLLEFYESEKINYRIVTMMRHPCRTEYYWEHRKFIKDLLNMLDLVPPERRFLLDYDEIMFQPKQVLRGLLEWMPELRELSLGSDNMHTSRRPVSSARLVCGNDTNPRIKGFENNQYRRRTIGMHLTSMAEFIHSRYCRVCLTPSHTANRQDMQMWERYKKEIRSVGGSTRLTF